MVVLVAVIQTVTAAGVIVDVVDAVARQWSDMARIRTLQVDTHHMQGG